MNTGGGDLFEDLKRNNGQMKEKYAVRDVIVPFINALQYLHGKVGHSQGHRATVGSAAGWLFGSSTPVTSMQGCLSAAT
jgi:hypothetical protein